MACRIKNIYTSVRSGHARTNRFLEGFSLIALGMAFAASAADFNLNGCAEFQYELSGAAVGAWGFGAAADCKSHPPDANVYDFRPQFCQRRGDFFDLDDFGF